MKSETGATHRDVEEAADREAAAIAGGDMAAYQGVLDEEAIFLPPNLALKGGAELREWLREFLERFTIQWLDFVHEEAAVSGDLAVHRFSYRWRVTPKAGGEAVVAEGKGMHVLRRRAGGPWKIWREIWNASPAPPVA
jgi:ketosteroid isomerase-like protein